jgi:hypothetical protein
LKNKRFLVENGHFRLTVKWVGRRRNLLTDIAIKSLKSKDKPYKVADRDGLYVSVAQTGTKTFRYDYRVNGRRETLTIGRYGRYGITLAAAREKPIDAKKRVGKAQNPITQVVDMITIRDVINGQRGVTSRRAIWWAMAFSASARAGVIADARFHTS